MTRLHVGSTGSSDLTDRERTAHTRDVVFTFSYVTWDAARRRGMHFAQDRLAAGLVCHSRVRKLLVSNPFRSAAAKSARTVLAGERERFPKMDGAGLHQPLRLRRTDPVSLPAIERAYRAYDASLERAAERAGLERPAVITMHPLIAGFCALEWAGPVTFYASDDWAAAPEFRRWWPAYEETYRRLRTGDRAVCAVSPAIIDHIRPSGPHEVVPNGVDPGEWIRPGPPPRWFTALHKPRILYLGSLESRIDVALLGRVADAFPDATIVLAGPLKEPAHYGSLQERPNVLIHPPVPRPEVPGLLSAAEVCLIPHARTPFTKAMSPLKLYEYLAAGRPVVAVDLPPLRGVDPRVLLVSEGRDFPGAVQRALRMGPAPESERLRFLAENSWSARHERILELAFRC